MKRKLIVGLVSVILACTVGGMAVAAKISLDSPATFPVDI